MSFYADLHIHSKYSRATSKSCDLENLAYWARKKGIAVVGTGDFTHPAWRAELREKLVPAEPGLFRLRDDIERSVERRVSIPGQRATRFLLSVEISTIYKKGERTRKIHHLVYAPDLDCVERMVARLSKIGNLHSDGRPILGLDSRDLLEIVLEAGEHAYLVPAHAWTPWFAVLGSRSGFDDVTACYGDLADHIFALETGLSSDPPMNWRVSRLDRYALMSSSDAHSPAKLGREACLFETEMDYFAMRRALETREGYGGTIEFFPEEGKYHLDGHRKCGVVLDPEETRSLEGRCPVCQKPLTVGVMHRVQELADRPMGFRPERASPFRSLVPLPEVIAELAGTGAGTKTVGRSYEGLLSRLGSEFFILDQAPIEDIRRRGSSQLAEAVSRMRAGQVICKPGFDGEYGVVRLFEDRELRREKGVNLRLRLPEGEGGTFPRSSDDPGSPPLPPPHAGVRPVARASTPASALAADVPAPGTGTRHPLAAGESNEGASRNRDDSDGLLSGLDPEQRAAAEHTGGPLLIIAGPGTGKTRTLTHRIAHLVAHRGIAPEACLAITFTNRAAGEMQERLQALLERMALAEAGERIWVKTFHGLALAILQEHRQLAGLHRGFRVADETERIALLASALGCSQRKARSALARISRSKREAAAGYGAEHACPAHPHVRPRADVAADHDLARALAAYHTALEAASLIDFDDLLLGAVALLESELDVRLAYQRRFQHICIDEYQDIDELQYRLVKLLCRPGHHGNTTSSLPSLPTSPPESPLMSPQEVVAGPAEPRNLCVIGDPDQAIYGFRGADVGFFLRFREDFPEAREVRLTRNYRSTRTIVDAALQAIAPTSLVSGRALSALAEGSRRVAVVEAASERAEADLVVRAIESLMGGTSFFSLDSGRVGHGREADLGFSDFAVLYRTDAQAGPVCEALHRAGVPYQKRSHSRLSEHPVVQGLLEVMRRGGTHELSGSALPASPLLPASSEEDLLVIEHLRRAASALLAAPGEDGAGQNRDDVKDALEMLAPLAERCACDLDRFFTEIAMDAEVDAWDPRADRVSLLTLHASKGLEFRVVFLVGCEDGILPMRWGARKETGAVVTVGRGVAGGNGADIASDHQEREQLQEERRLFFVGMTRARELLYLTRARKRMWRGKVREQAISPFILDIEDELLARKAPGGRKKISHAREQLGLF